MIDVRARFMARPLRIEYPGALHHVMSRGVDRCLIVHDDIDRFKRLHWLERTVDRFRWRLHAFVLMPNHEHLFIETPLPNLSRGMQYLNAGYAGYFNDRHDRVGHLFQGRFKSHLVEEDGHYHELSRYIHLNPRRAGLVRLPEDYPWSSYPGYVRADLMFGWVTYGRILREFDDDQAEARRAYQLFVQAGMEQGIVSPFAEATSGLLIGSEAFVNRIKGILAEREPDPGLPQLTELKDRPPLESILKAVAAAFGVPAYEFCCQRRADDPSRAVAAYLARRIFCYPRIEVAKALGYTDSSSVTRAVQRAEVGDGDLKKKITRIAQGLTNH